MQINNDNLLEMINTFSPEEVYQVEISSIIDAGINPREVDVKYAEQIPESAPAILLGIIENDEELQNSLIIIDGNHRLYSYMNVHDLKYIPAKIKKYKNRGEAIIDAYRCNMHHGKRLTDKEVAEGIRKTIQFLKGENNEKTYKELMSLLNISKSGIYEYVIWDKVSKILKEDVNKIKANKLHTILKDNQNGEENLKLFWELNKNLSVRNIEEAIKYYKKTGEIVDWEKYKVRLAMMQDDEDDGLETKSITITKLSEIKKEEVKQEQIEDDEDEDEEFEMSDVEEEDDVSVNDIIEEDENDLEEDEPNYNVNNFAENNVPINEGRKIEVNKMKEVKKDDHLVSVPGLVRKYSFETVMNNVFEELTEGVITSSNSLNEVLEKHLHDNRQIFESKKEEYFRALDNIQLVLNKMRKKLEKANKDLKQ